MRLESFESEETQKLVRGFTGGSFANTAFVVLAPDGKTRLTRTGRSPHMVFGSSARGIPGSKDAEKNNEVVYSKLEKIAAKYPSKAPLSKSVVQDFDSFKQSLNVASGDQRLLVFTVAGSSTLRRIKQTFIDVVNDPDVIGRYHFDFAGKADSSWSEAISNDTKKSGIFIIQSGEFGQDGKVLAELDLQSNKTTILAALDKANKEFKASEKRKVYNQHLSKGRQEGITYEDNMPYGEDRDGDGVIDTKRLKRR